MDFEKKIGSLWKKKSNKGTTFLTGVITVDGEELRVVGFINKNKKNEKAPDINLYPSKPYKKDKTQVVRDVFEDFN